MLRILKDCIFAGTSVHAGEIYPADDFDKSNVQVIIGAGFAEFYTPEEDEIDTMAEEPEDFTVAPVKTEPAVKKTTRKKKK